MAPWASPVPASSRRARFGTSPASMSYSTLALVRVPQEADDVGGRRVGVEQLGQHPAVLAGEQRLQVGLAGRPGAAHRLGPEQGHDRGRHVDQPGRQQDEALLPHARPGQHERRPHLDDAERAVLARSPPWSSQLWAGECRQTTSGACGWSSAGRSGRGRAG